MAFAAAAALVVAGLHASLPAQRPPAADQPRVDPVGERWRWTAAATDVAGLSGLIAMAASFGGNELCLRYGRRRVITFVMAGSALTAGAVAAARPGMEGATLAVHAFIGIGPLILGVVLDATGGGATSLSWGLAFVSMAVIVLLGPPALRLCR